MNDINNLLKKKEKLEIDITNWIRDNVFEVDQKNHQLMLIELNNIKTQIESLNNKN